MRNLDFPVLTAESSLYHHMRFLVFGGLEGRGRSGMPLGKCSVAIAIVQTAYLVLV
jgi:hypothetical protein